MISNTLRLRLLFALPIVGIGVVIFILAIGLRGGNHTVHPSTLIAKPFPSFEAPKLIDNELTNHEELLGEARLINVWASWCVACRSEHAVIQDIAASNLISVVGINYKDQRVDALDWLTELGNPYDYTIVDLDGTLGVDLGVYGAPETFLVDPKGYIRYKHIGALTDKVWEGEILPLIEDLD
ncbi:MAG: DsbE family thiol:disulfide interchange protein [Gammaproteobacteria bacterium]|nr:DsbE family thiol:disulfide interchange protein [Gammaproteobacteria bacterium]MDE0251674.1 DsbE family thiol:disulfide interchange protein [Gammaproteobacteria bacterium]MDE0403316.1 DsbE family thiol:disulfide interchange protein [Gammaproteobacteria bacterium]